MRSGMEAFSQGRVADSVKLFDESAQAGYPKAMLWQRGLSLYYADRFEEEWDREMIKRSVTGDRSGVSAAGRSVSCL